MKPIYIIEMGVSAKDVSTRQLELIRNADIVVGERRYLDFFDDISAMKKEITKDYRGVIDFILSRMSSFSIVVLSSADPLVFSMGSLLIQTLGREKVFIFPNSTSVVPVSMVGMGVCPNDLTPQHLAAIRQADILIGHQCHLEHFREHPGQKKEITANIDDIVEYIESWIQRKSIAVLISGDPLLHETGRFLLDAVGPQNVHVLPNVTPISVAFSRIRETWHDAQIVGLKSRFPEQEILAAIQTSEKVAVFTDSDKPPNWVAGVLVTHQKHDYSICVLERLGFPTEQVGWYTPKQASIKEFTSPNMMIIRRLSPLPAQMKRIGPAVPDIWPDYGQECIDQMEIQTVAMTKLRLNYSNLILWHIGSDRGMLGIDAARFIQKGSVYIVESNPEHVETLEKTQKRFRINNLKIVQGALTRDMAQLPCPDRVFIRHDTQEFRQIVDMAVSQLSQDGIVVIETELIEHLDDAIEILREYQIEPDIIQVQINRCVAISGKHRFNGQVPVWILTGEKGGYHKAMEL